MADGRTDSGISEPAHPESDDATILRDPSQRHGERPAPQDSAAPEAEADATVLRDPRDPQAMAATPADDAAAEADATVLRDPRDPQADMPASAKPAEPAESADATVVRDPAPSASPDPAAEAPDVSAETGTTDSPPVPIPDPGSDPAAEATHLASTPKPAHRWTPAEQEAEPTVLRPRTPSQSAETSSGTGTEGTVSSTDTSNASSQTGSLPGSLGASTLDPHTESEATAIRAGSTMYRQAVSDRTIMRNARPEWQQDPAEVIPRGFIHYDAPPEPEVVEPRRMRPMQLLAIVVAIVVAGASLGWGYVTFFYQRAPQPDTIVHTAAPTQGIERPHEVVRQYLDALAAGDTATAMSLGAVGEGDTSAISPEAYKRSLESHPITDIRVTRSDTSTTQVRATYRIGDRPVDTSFRVQRDDNGFWTLAQSTLSVEFQVTNADDIPLYLNGVRIYGTMAEVLPGFYDVSSGLPYLDFPENNDVLVTNLEYEGRVQRVLTPLLTEDGRQALIDVGRSSLATCLTRATLDPPGCPNRIVAPAPYDPASVRWTLVGDPFASANPALEPYSQSKGHVSMALEFEVSFTYTDGTTSGTQHVGPVTASYVTSLIGTSPADLTPAWSRA